MVITEGSHAAEFTLSEGNGYISREQGLLRKEQGALAAGTLLGRVTSSGKLSAYSNADSPAGVGTVVGILYAPQGASTTDRLVAYVARDAEVVGDLLVGLDADARVDLKALNIIVR